MLKKIFPILFISFSFIFISCPHDCIPQEYKVFGKSIKNFPEWTKEVLASDWKPWNTEETAEFKKLFKQKESLNSDENINYRLFVTGQNLVLFFDDKDSSFCNPLWIWVSEYKTGVNSVSFPQEKEDEFVFEGHALNNIFAKKTDKNKAEIEIKLLNPAENKCSYILKVNGVEIINEILTATDLNLKNYKIKYDDLRPLGYIDDEQESDYGLFFECPCSCFIVFDDTDEHFCTTQHFDSYSDSPCFLYFEGFGEKSYNADNTILTYELLGGTENMSHYIDLTYNNDKNAVEYYFYDLDDDGNKINKNKSYQYTLK